MSMFGTVPITHVTFQVLSEDANELSLALAEWGRFLPQGNAELSEHLPQDPAQRYRAELAVAESRLQKLLQHYAIPPAETLEPFKPVSLDTLLELQGWLGEQWAHASQTQEAARKLHESIRNLDTQLATLENFRALDIDLGLLQENGSRFLDLRVGTLASENVQRLTQAAELSGYVVSEFLQTKGQSYVVVAGSKGEEATLESVLRAAGWRSLRIPDEFKDHPESIHARLTQTREALQAEFDALQHDIAQQGQALALRLRQASQTLMLAAPFSEMGEALRARNTLTVVSGWVPAEDITPLYRRLRRRIKAPVAMLTREPRRGEAVPSMLKHPRWIKPFVTLVNNFGTPRYGEFNPTWLFVITYLLMFGTMFGDVGHGLVIAGLGVVLRRHLFGFAPFMILAGLSATLFGFVYGSFFGYKTVIPALWMSPMYNPNLLLKLALYWGIAFITLAISLSIYNRVRAGQLKAALFDGRGVAGVVLYAGLIFTAYQWLSHGAVHPLSWLAIFLPLLTIMGYHWQHADSAYGERAITVLIEGLENIIGLFSSTLSFLRVAAFSLNHVALALAVFALANMMDTTGYWLMVIAGNIFIIVLEGAIVAIQTLRLEYYEGFSRFFSGDGRPFKPLRLRTQPPQ